MQLPPARARVPAERHRWPSRRVIIPSGALPSVALEGFCADFASKIEATWPNIDASTAAALAPVVSQWADKAEMAEVKADVTTIATWITTMATAGSVSTPPPDVTTAFDRPQGVRRLEVLIAV